ncbi:MAG: hypothetical protein DRG24_06250 [Epsilonproteobacteria bacterium]|nr:MAG: hypothetical protein DRG24_06250 [Campylobacterota bacterium]
MEYLTICGTDQQEISFKISKAFGLNTNQSNVLANDLEAALRSGDMKLFYKVRYYIHMHDNPEYSRNVFKCAFDTYIFLVNKVENEPFRDDLGEFFLKFYENIYYEECKQAQKIGKRSDTVKKVLQHMTAQSNKMLATQKLMIANISHEMRTSLNAISGYIIQINEKDVLRGEEKAYLEKADTAATALRMLVADILDISKINSGQMEIKESLFWLDEVILHSIDNMMMSANKKNLTFTSNVDFFAQRMLGDAQRIMEILTNLLSNAVKFTDSGFIHLRVKKTEEKHAFTEVLFRIEDSGIGMSQEQLKDIFEPYTRFENERQGVGLGMFIAHKLAKKMNGDLRVQSELGKGTTFDFTVRLKQETEASVNMTNRLICFFNDTKDSNHKNIFDQKLLLLEQYGAKIASYTDEAEFTNQLLNVQEKVPDIISIITYQESYAKYDALINYLKSFKKFDRTYFIAEQTGARLPLNHFDQSFERFSTLSAYIHAIEIINKQRNKKDQLMKKALRILAVDDIETNLEVLKLFITNKYPGAVLDMALGGYEAVGMYKTSTYDIIFLDLKMPGLNGFNVLEKLKAIKTPPQVHALTADVYKDTFDKVMSAGFTGMLEKPLQPNILFETIEKAINE